MFGNPGDDECTADIGVGGHRGCHRWPGCGCGGSVPDPEPARSRRDYDVDFEQVRIVELGHPRQKFTQHRPPNTSAREVLRDIRRKQRELALLIDRMEELL